MKNWILLALLLVVGSLSASPGVMREWAPIVGDPVRAEYLGKVGEFYWLAREDGQVLKVRWIDFSEADQEYLEGIFAVQNADLEAGLRISSWDANEDDDNSIALLKVLVTTTIPVREGADGTVTGYLSYIEKVLSDGHPELYRLAVVAPSAGAYDRQTRLNLPELRAYEAIEMLARSADYAYRLANGRVILERRRK